MVMMSFRLGSVQRIKTCWNDKGLREILWQTVEAEGRWSACTRIHEITGPSVDHSSL